MVGFLRGEGYSGVREAAEVGVGKEARVISAMTAPEGGSQRESPVEGL